MSEFEKGEIEADVLRLRNAGADIEMLLRFMREKGLNEAKSLGPLANALGINRGKARDLIIESETWADHHESNIQLQEDLVHALLEKSEEGPNFIVEFDEDDPESQEP